jgi:hypothetical protein
MSKHPISWHLECLHNWEHSLNKMKAEVEREKQRLDNEEYKYKFYSYQILAARKKGKTEFDHEKYMVKRVKIK